MLRSSRASWGEVVCFLVVNLPEGTGSHYTLSARSSRPFQKISNQFQIETAFDYALALNLLYLQKRGWMKFFLSIWQHSKWRADTINKIIYDYFSNLTVAPHWKKRHVSTVSALVLASSHQVQPTLPNFNCLLKPMTICFVLYKYT